MNTPNASDTDVEKLYLDLWQVIEKYENIDDREIQKVVRKIRRMKKRVSCDESMNKAVRILVIADRVRELWQWLSDNLPPPG